MKNRFFMFKTPQQLSILHIHEHVFLKVELAKRIIILFNRLY